MLPPWIMGIDSLRFCARHVLSGYYLSPIGGIVRDIIQDAMTRHGITDDVAMEPGLPGELWEHYRMCFLPFPCIFGHPNFESPG